MNVLSVLAFAGLLAPPQSTHQVAKVIVPYELHVADSTLPEGEYVIQVLHTNSDIPQILFQPVRGGRQILANAGSIPAPDGAPARATVVAFERRGNAFQLKKIWIEGWTTGYEFR